jgi:hypothetical protein
VVKYLRPRYRILQRSNRGNVKGLYLDLDVLPPQQTWQGIFCTDRQPTRQEQQAAARLEYILVRKDEKERFFIGVVEKSFGRYQEHEVPKEANPIYKMLSNTKFNNNIYGNDGNELLIVEAVKFIESLGGIAHPTFNGEQIPRDFSRVNFLQHWRGTDQVIMQQEIPYPISDVVLNTCDQNNAFLSFMISQTEKNYRALYSPVEIDDSCILAERVESAAWQFAYLEDTCLHRWEFTLLAGANLLIEDWVRKTEGKDGGYIFVPQKELRTPLQLTGSAKSWMGRPVIPLYDQRDMAISKALNSITFEIQYRGVLRLDDHVHNMMESLCILNVSDQKEVLMAKFLPQVKILLLENNNMLLNQIKIAQLTFSYDDTELFYRLLGLIDKTCLFNSSCKNIDFNNYNVKSVVFNATQPFSTIHLEQFGGGADLSNDAITFKHDKMTARFLFVSGLTKFYYYELHSMTSYSSEKAQSILELLNTVKEEYNAMSSNTFLDDKYKSQINKFVDGITEMIEWKGWHSNFKSRVSGFFKSRSNEFPKIEFFEPSRIFREFSLNGASNQSNGAGMVDQINGLNQS